MRHAEQIAEMLVDAQILRRIHPDVESPPGLHEITQRLEAFPRIFREREDTLAPYVVEARRDKRSREDISLKNSDIRQMDATAPRNLDRGIDVNANDLRRILAKDAQQEPIPTPGIEHHLSRQPLRPDSHRLEKGLSFLLSR